MLNEDQYVTLPLRSAFSVHHSAFLPDLCPTCGYDLRATPAKSGPLFDRCPECGSAVPRDAPVEIESP